MVKLLQKMDSREADDWKFVRRHVHPAPKPPVEYEGDGSVKRENFDWPPKDPENLNAEQKAWRSYLLWPDHIRRLLHQDDWSTESVRSRLAAYGRMYALLHDFQTRKPFSSPTRESEYWRTFAESMLAYGDDGRSLLVANMIVALSNPDDGVVYMAQEILVQVGEPAIEPLCAAMWTSHRQRITVWEEEADPRDPTGRMRIRTETTTTIGNPNYNEYVMDTLYRIGPRVAGHAITELEISLDKNGKSIGTAWRFRRYFVELLGRLGPVLGASKRADALKAIELEIDRVVVQEYDEDRLQKGEMVVDKRASDDAAYLWREYLLQAIGNLGDVEGIRPIIKLWKVDEGHDVASVSAISKLTKRKVRSIEDAREVAKAFNVDLKGE
jgi:hypothetical protein